jgi:ribosomal protein S10
MAKVPNGTWQPFDLKGDRRHECSSEPLRDEGWSLKTLGHRLTCQMDCWWCSDEVFFHTNGNGDCVLFDSLGWPWPTHRCWEEHVGERDEAIRRTEDLLRSQGYDGNGELVNVRPSEAPETIPTKGRANPPDLRIKLSSTDHQVIDRATSRLVNTVSERHHRPPLAFPLPAVSESTEEEFTNVKHQRVIDVWSADSALIVRLDQMQLSDRVTVSFKQSAS